MEKANKHLQVSRDKKDYGSKSLKSGVITMRLLYSKYYEAFIQQITSIGWHQSKAEGKKNASYSTEAKHCEKSYFLFGFLNFAFIYSMQRTDFHYPWTLLENGGYLSNNLLLSLTCQRFAYYSTVFVVLINTYISVVIHPAWWKNWGGHYCHHVRVCRRMIID